MLLYSLIVTTSIPIRYYVQLDSLLQLLLLNQIDILILNTNLIYTEKETHNIDTNRIGLWICDEQCAFEGTHIYATIDKFTLYATVQERQFRSSVKVIFEKWHTHVAHIQAHTSHAYIPRSIHNQLSGAIFEHCPFLSESCFKCHWKDDSW